MRIRILGQVLRHNPPAPISFDLKALQHQLDLLLREHSVVRPATGLAIYIGKGDLLSDFLLRAFVQLSQIVSTVPRKVLSDLMSVGNRIFHTGNKVKGILVGGTHLTNAGMRGLIERRQDPGSGSLAVFDLDTEIRRI